MQHIDQEGVTELSGLESLSGTGSAKGESMESGQEFGVITCIIDMCFAEDTLEQAVALLVSTVGCTEAMQGCRSCVVTRAVGEAFRVRYIGEWESESALLRHLRSDEFRRVLTSMDMCSSEPLARIGDLSGREGLQYLSEMRRRASAAEE